jgi:hypothetical protein
MSGIRRVQSVFRLKGYTEETRHDGTLFWSVFLIVVLLSAGLRFWNLSVAPIWQDEAVTRAYAQLDLWTLLTKNIDNHPPLTWVVQHLWHHINPAPEATRIPAALIGTLSVAAVMLFVRDFAGGRSALVAGLLLAISSGHIYYSQDARMYVFLVLGVILAAWGAVGHAETGRLKAASYSALYITGGAIAIYSHILGLVAMACIGTASLVAAILGKTERWHPVARRWFVMNLILFVLVLPWLVRLPMVLESFPGLWDQDIANARWYIFNMLGFPGAPGILRRLALLALLALIGLCILALWLSSRRALALVLFSMLAVFPLAIVGLQVTGVSTIISNRAFTPVIPTSLAAAAIGLSVIRLQTLQVSMMALILAAGITSAHQILSHGIKPDDFAGAFSYAEAAGFGEAPVLTCNAFCAASIWENRPDAVIFDYRRGEVMRYSGPEFWRAAVNSMHWLHMASIEEIDAFHGGGWHIQGGLAKALEGYDRITFMVTSCDSSIYDEQNLKASIAEAGFSSSGPEFMVLGRARQEVLLTIPETRVQLYERRL